MSIEKQNPQPKPPTTPRPSKIQQPQPTSQPQKKKSTIFIAIIVLLFLIISLILGFWLFNKNKSTQPSSQKTISNQQTTSSPVSIPQNILDNKFGFPSGSPRDADIYKQFGVGWVRPHPGPFQWGTMQKTFSSPIDFSVTDKFILGSQKYQMGTLVTLWPFASWDQEKLPNYQKCLVSEKDIMTEPNPKFDQKDFMQDEKDFMKDPEMLKDPQVKGLKDIKEKFGKEMPGEPEMFFIPQSRCNPHDWNGYLAWVEKVVERYDGDGTNDMPGLQIPVKYWEVLNEPDLNANHLDFYQGTGSDYAQLLIKTSAVIRKADPEAKVLIAGAAGGNNNFLNFYRQVLKNPETHNAFDIGNVHCISNDDYNSYNVSPYKNLLQEFKINKPIWVTEAEALVSYDININASQTLKSTKTALSLGTERIFYAHQMFNRDPNKPSAPEANLKLSDYQIKLKGSDPLSAFRTITSQ